MDRYFRSMTVLRHDRSDALRYETFSDVVLAGLGDSRPNLYQGAQRIMEKKLKLAPDGYVTTWFELAPDALTNAPHFWTLSVWWRSRKGDHHHSIWGESLPSPHDTRSVLFGLARRMVVENHGVPEKHAVLSFDCSPSMLAN
ncbi:hypothetical protein OHS33_39400 (plasmid) [Streptomyces sp. NBC_00536]|uniref:hypothetical protein n=1 Tax=Streptomyces sp. NBC_00536 TaxID=2975769 RepID=UPI002E820306|nr:hypothetical protein [Streptomyces sp. NBC_00536]WUC84522.1 hypothetical protein OHS33_39400 [Streptomyces sp. NBC_00536]